MAKEDYIIRAPKTSVKAKPVKPVSVKKGKK